MTKDKVYELAYTIIAEQQSNTKLDDNRDSFVYLMAFNDGVIQLAEEIAKEICKCTNVKENEEK